ncbi:MAG: class I SAM-dependent methyltransferase, partial [Candidatus Thorarchaeota archaeon]|nr:class I SAM-dependent methyltransferase [Candidatus Thorarchaeota archaeon]
VSDIPFYLDYAQKAGSPILDLAAGTGRVTFELAHKGFEVVALEQSTSMMAEARKKLEISPKDVSRRITLVEGSMKEFSLDQKFPLIIVPNSFVHLLTTEDQLSTIQCVKDHLTDDGLFILDLYPGELQYEHATFEDIPAKLPDGGTVTRSGVIQSDLPNHLMRIELRYTVRDVDGQVINEIDVVSGAALLFQQEVDLLIQMSSMIIENEFGDFEKNPYTPDSGRRIFVLKMKE